MPIASRTGSQVKTALDLLSYIRVGEGFVLIKQVDTLHCFPQLNDSLSKLLNELQPQEWVATTHYPNWKVKDIVTHLLDTSLRRLSSQRDNFRVASRQSILSPSELINHITLAADRWAEATAFFSPSILIELVQRYQSELVAYFRTLDLEAESRIPVNWAGQAVSTNWFDIAREYTERWHHQMQIREALGKPAILDRELYHPVLDTFMQALPHHYRDTRASDGYILEVHISGDSGGRWFLQWNGPMRELKSHVDGRADTILTLEPDVAWKVFTRFNKSMYDSKIQVEGDTAMGNHLLEMKCVMVE